MNLRERYWPCAPDGFIPNSIIRELYNKKITSIVHREEEKWTPPKWKDDWNSDDEDRVRTWLSEDDDDSVASDISILDDSKHSAKPSQLPREEVQTRKVTPDHSQSNDMSRHIAATIPKEKQPTIASKLVKKISFIQLEKTSKLEINEEQETDGEQLIPYPFLEYHKAPWFPTDIGYEIATVTSALLATLGTTQAEDLNDMLQCIIKAHRFSTLDAEHLLELVTILLKLLDDDNPQVRQCSAHSLCELRINSKDVILKLIPKLDDPSIDVRKQVKRTLGEIAGIIDAATLTSALREFGRFKDTQNSCDVKVIESFHDLIVARRDSFRERLNQLYSTFGGKDAKMLAFVDYVTRPSARMKPPKVKPNEEESVRINNMKSVQRYSEKENEELLQSQKNITGTPQREEEERLSTTLDTVEPVIERTRNIEEPPPTKRKRKANKQKTDINTLEHVALATAIRALKERRSNTSSLDDLPEILSEVYQLLQFLQEKKVKENSIIQKRMEDVYNLQERLQIFNDEKIPENKPQCLVRHLIPSSIRRNMLPGIIGERILSGLHVLPTIHKLRENHVVPSVIKSIPGRYGIATVTQNGAANYGMINYHWTTYTLHYDAGINYHRQLQNQDVYEEANLITYKNDRFGKYGKDSILSEPPPPSLSPLHNDFSNKTVLPQIKRRLLNVC